MDFIFLEILKIIRTCLQLTIITDCTNLFEFMINFKIPDKIMQTLVSRVWFMYEIVRNFCIMIGY